MNKTINSEVEIETVKSVVHSIMATGWDVSRDLMAAYSCSDTSEIQKIPSFHIQTSGFSVHGLTIQNVPKPLDVFSQINEYNSSKLQLCTISLLLYLDNLPIRDLISINLSSTQNTLFKRYKIWISFQI